jgi:hypothetical protein
VKKEPTHMDASTRVQNKNFAQIHFGFPRHWSETIVKYKNGTTYKGWIDERSGDRVGFGLLLCHVYHPTPNPLKKWQREVLERNPLVVHENYLGLWKDDKPRGKGTWRLPSKTGDTLREVTGEWYGKDCIPDQRPQSARAYSQ